MNSASLTTGSEFKRSSEASIWPGLLLCVGVTAVAAALQHVEEALFGAAWLESLVIAILLGTAIRSCWAPGERWSVGIRFSSKTLLEIAVVTLGVNVSTHMISEAGAGLLIGIVAVVFLSLCISYGFGRALGLPRKMAVLIACGNSICGNSAIAAVAPVIEADSDDVAGAIAFTAVLGIAVVVGLPLLAVALKMSPTGYGVLSGLTVYAVSQVLAATAPISSVSAQVGTLVKLIRVLTLGPVVLVLSLIYWRARKQQTPQAFAGAPGLGVLVPWFIVGFIAMICARSAGLIPQAAIAPAGVISNWLTVVSMAGLGLGVDVRQLARAGVRVAVVVTLSLVALGGISWVLIQMLALDPA